MAENLLRKTKEIEENVYKIDFGINNDEPNEDTTNMKLEIAKEMQPQRDSSGKVIRVIKESDDMFGKLRGSDIAEAADEKTTTQKQIPKIEDGITSRKTTKIAKTTKAKEAKATKTPGKRGRKPKLKDIETIADNQSAIKMHTEGNLTEIILIENNYKIELEKTEYNIYTEAKQPSYRI